MLLRPLVDRTIEVLYLSYLSLMLARCPLFRPTSPAPKVSPSLESFGEMRTAQMLQILEPQSLIATLLRFHYD
jgi:hypothetical protein